MKVVDNENKRRKKNEQASQRKYAQNIKFPSSNEQVVVHHSQEDDGELEVRKCIVL